MGGGERDSPAPKTDVTGSSGRAWNQKSGVQILQGAKRTLSVPKCK